MLGNRVAPAVKYPEPEMSEAQLQVAVARYLDAVLRPPVLWTSIDAGAGKMRPRTANQRKRRGVKKGWPDILIMAPGPSVMGLELKTSKGTLLPEQIAMEQAFFNCKAWFVTCRSVNDVERALAFLKMLPKPLEAA